MTKMGRFGTSLEKKKGMGWRTLETSAQNRGEQSETGVSLSGQSLKWFSLSKRLGHVNSVQTRRA